MKLANKFILKLIFMVSFILYSIFGFSQTPILTANFETANDNYSLTGTATGSFGRFNKSDQGTGHISNNPILNTQGDFYIFSDDLDAATEITLSSVDLTGYNNLRVSLLLAAPGGNDQYDAGEYIKIQYSVDGNPFVTLAQFSGEAGTDTFISEDTDQDDEGDGINRLNATLTENSFLADISGESDLTNVVVRVQLLSSNANEDYVIDNIRVFGEGIGYTSITPSNVSVVKSDLSELVIEYPLNVVANSGTVTITETSGPTSTVYDVVTDIANFNGLGTNQISLDVSSITFTDGQVYEVDVASGIFENSFGAQTEAIVGNSTWSFSIDGTPPIASAPINTAQSLQNGVASTSTIQSNEDGNIYLILSTEATPTTQAEINAMILSGNAFLGQSNAIAATPYTVTPPALANEGLYNILAVDNVGFLSAPIAGWLTVDNTAPTNENTVFSTSETIQGSTAVTIVSSGNTNNQVWFAPAGTATFSAGPTMTQAGGTATTIQSPANDGDYKLFVIDAAGNISSASTATLTVDSTPPLLVIGLPSLTYANNSATVDYTITYTEANSVLLQANDISLTTTGDANATVSIIDGTTNTPEVRLVSATGNGTIAINIGANTAQDVAGNMTTAQGPSTVFTVDNTSPQATVTINSDPIYTGDLVQTVEVSYGESMNQSTTPTINIGGNFTASGGLWSSATTFVQNFTHDGTSEEITSTTVSMTAGGAQDLAGNNDIADATLPSFQIDTQRPFLSPDQMILSLNGGGRETVEFTMNEPINLSNNALVTGFTSTNGSVRTSGLTKYITLGNTVSLESNSNGQWNDMTDISYNPGTGNIVDMVGNEMATITNHNLIDSDASSPTINPDVITLYPNGTSVESLEFTLSEELDLNDLASLNGFTVSAGSIGSAVYSDKGNTNTVTLTSASNGQWDNTVTVNYTQDGSSNVKDFSGNEMANIVNHTVIYENIPPVLNTLTVASNNTFDNKLVKGSETVTVSFSTNEGLNITSILLSNIRSGGTVINNNTVTYNTIGINQYSATFNISNADIDGVISFNLAFSDEAGNNNGTPINQTNITSGGNVVVDNTVPFVNSITAVGSTGPSPFTSVQYDIQFSEEINNLDASDFEIISTGILPTPGFIISAPVSNSYRITLNNLDLDNALNQGSISLNFKTNGSVRDNVGLSTTNDFNSGVTFQIIHPEPADAVTNFDFVSANINSITLNWDKSSSDQLPQNYLLLVKDNSGGSYASVSDGNFVSNDTNIGDGNMAINIAYGTALPYAVNGLSSSTEYSFRIYPYTNTGLNVNYKTTGIPEVTASTTAAAVSLLSQGSIAEPNTISSIINSQGDAQTNFDFRYQEDGTLFTYLADNANSLLTEIIFTQGSFNEVIDWSTVIEGAVLSDGSNSQTGTINANNITFSSINVGNGQLGFIQDNQIKNYTLSIWLKNTLPNGIENKQLNFEIDGNNISYGSGSSTLSANQNEIAGNNTNVIDIRASEILWAVQPEPFIGVLKPFGNAPVLNATDANGNIDSDYNGTISAITNTSNIPINNTPVGNAFTNGIYTFVNSGVSSFSYNNAGNGTLTASAVQGSQINSQPSNNVTVSYSNGTTIINGPTPEPLTLSSLATNAFVFDFTITDDVSPIVDDNVPTRLNTVTINASGGANTLTTNWNELIRNAYLTDGSTTITATNITTNNITFSNVPNASSTDFGYIKDGESKTYELQLTLQNNLPTLSNTIDNDHLNFNITDSDITLESQSSTFANSQSVTSGAANNEINVIASNLVFETQPTTTFINQVMAPVVTIAAKDAYGNLDVDYAGSASLTSTGNLSQAVTTNLSSGEGNASDIIHNTLGNNIFLTSKDNLNLLSSTNSTTFNIIPGIGESDITASNFSYIENIDYTSDLGTTVTDSNPKVFQFDINDGTSGTNTTDIDELPTFVTSLSLSISNFEQLESIGLFDDSNTIIGTPIPSASSITFDLSASPIEVDDDDNVTLHLRTTFKSNVTDNTQFSFSISNAVASDQGSTFQSSNGSRNTGTPATSSIIGDDNRIEVEAMQLEFENITGISVSTPFSPIVWATDLNDNIDLDFNRNISSYSNLSTNPLGPINTINNPNTSGDSFTSGRYTFPTQFQFSESGEGVTLTIETAGFTGANAAISNTFNILSAFESYITYESDGGAIPYVNFGSTADLTNTNSFKIAEFQLHDGNPNRYGNEDGNGGDLDGAPTVINELTITFSNDANLDMVGVFDASGTQYGIDIPATPSITFTGLNFSAPDNQTNNFFIKASFKDSPNDITDNAKIDLTITSVVAGNGSQFEVGTNAGGEPDGLGGFITPQTPPGNNFINVVATNYDFTQSPNAVEGLGNLISIPMARAIDVNQVVDVDYSAEFIISTPAIGGASTSPTTASFSNGTISLLTLEYTSVGEGTLTLTQSNTVGLVTNNLSLNTSTDVEVVNTLLSSYDIEKFPPQNAGATPTLQSGEIDQVIHGFSLTANATDPAFDVRFNTVTLDFSKEITDVFENLRIFKVTNDNEINPLIDVDYQILSGASIDLGASNNSSIVINGFDDQLIIGESTSYVIVSDISVAAFSGSGPITLSITPQTTYLATNSGSMTGNTVTSPSYNFADTKGPLIVVTNPVNKSIAAPTEADFSITFDENVLQNSPIFELRHFDDNSLVNYSNVLVNTSNSTTLDKTYNIKFVNAFGLTIDLVPGIRYYITLKKEGFMDQSGNLNISANTSANPLENDIENKGFWTFTTKDLNPPQFTNGTINELVDKIYDIGFDIKVKLDEPGIAYVLVKGSGGSNPNFNELKTDINSVSVEVNKANTFYYLNVRGLNNNTDYKIFVGAEDTGGNEMLTGSYPSTANNHVQLIAERTSTFTNMLNEPELDICVGEFQEISAPIVVVENSDNAFTNGNNVFDLVLPNGYIYNTSEGMVSAVSGGNINSAPVLTYRNNSTIRISFNASGTNARDEIRVSDLQIRATSQASNDNIVLNGNISGIPFESIAASINVSSLPPATFTLSPNGVVINSLSTDKVALEQDDPIDPYIGEKYIFSGNGVLNDTLYVNLAGIGTNKITLTQTYEGGCQAIGDLDVNIINNEFVGLNFIYCSDQPIVTVIQNINDPSEPFNGYNLEDLTVNVDDIPLEQQGALNSFNSATFEFDPSLAIPNPETNTAEFVQLNFEGIYRRRSNANDVIQVSQTIRIYPAPEVELSSITSPDEDGDGIIEVCEDFGNVIFRGLPADNPPNAAGIYTLIKENTGEPYNDQIINNSDKSITINSQNLKNIGAGRYRVTYSYNNSVSSCTAEASLVLIINANPKVEFEAGISCTGEATTFNSDLSTGELTNATFQWNFDDLTSGNNTSADRNTSHVYTTSGIFNPELMITSEKGCFSSATTQIQVGAIPQTQFDYTGVNLNDTFEFTSNTPQPTNLSTDVITSLSWDFGNGTDITYDRMSETDDVFEYSDYTKAFNDSVSLTVTTSLGCAATLTRPIAVLEYTDVATTASNGFESGAEGWIITSPVNNSWTLSAQNSNIDQAGNFMWVTNADQSYLANERSYVYSPTFDISNISKPLVQFDANVDMATGDGVIIQYSTDNLNITDPAKIWTELGAINTGQDWYNEDNLPSVPGGGTIDFGWSGSLGLIESKHILDSIPMNARTNLNLRFILASVNSSPNKSGFAFDNIQIGSRTRNVLIENFTNITGSSTVRNEAEYLSNQFPTNDENVEVIKINYHTDFPTSDFFNIQNRIDPSARSLYYDIKEIPRAVIDGNIYQNQPFSQWGKQAYQLRTLELADFDIDINVTTADGKLNINADIIPVQQTSGNNVIVTVAIVEKSVIYENNTYEYVLKKLLPNAAGIKINANELVLLQALPTLDFSWYPNNVANLSNLAVVVFVQDEQTKEIYQAEIYNDVPTVEFVTGTDSGLNTEQIKLFPNPANNNVKITFATLGNTENEVAVYDSFGKLVYFKTIDAGKKQLDINTTDLASGLYHIKIKSDDELPIVKRLIIAHK